MTKLSGLGDPFLLQQSKAALGKQTKAKHCALASGIAASVYGINAKRRQLWVFGGSSRQAQQTQAHAQQGPLGTVTQHARQRLNPAKCIPERGLSFQSLSWLWHSPLKRSASQEGQDGTPATSSVVEPPVDALHSQSRAPKPRPPGKMQPLPEESGPVLLLETRGAMIPSPVKASKLGEDAYFVLADGSAFGVADGVGGWILSGIDSGHYSRKLMQMSEFFIESKRFDAHPKQVLWAAYNQTQLLGSSTACLLKVKHDQLHATNCGDSGFVIIRGSEVAFQSPSQQHKFNFPRQLGRPGLNRAAETPARAQIFKCQLRPGDIIVAGTDGLFDNVFVEEVAALVRHARTRGLCADDAAKRLAKYAFRKALDRGHMSPFAYGAQADGQKYVGGKMDDITVIISYVSGPAETNSASSSGSSSGSGNSSNGSGCHDGQDVAQQPLPVAKL